MSEMKRWDLVWYEQNDEHKIEEVRDGDYVKFSDIEPLIEALKFYESGRNIEDQGCETYVGKCPKDSDFGKTAREALAKIGVKNEN